jgi:hypothetical protein
MSFIVPAITVDRVMFVKRGEMFVKGSIWFLSHGSTGS